eukprot:TRINITY_DN2761_c0_g1_i5.p1 TRINITY_DN2761_c0_g1~~TRINITY_DN2761_c0_g1_i5.p1  ORF type:complete len:193 (+),score=83.38 TRINITY_DN2761_c0_g1_i5:100-678(+)
MTRHPPRSTLSSSSAASDVYKRQVQAQASALEQQLSTLLKESDSSQISKIKARNAELANSLVGKQVQIDELMSSRQAVSMRAEAERGRAEEAVQRLQAQLHDDEADIEQGGGGAKRFRKLEQKYVPKQAANAIDKLSLVVVNLLKAFPLFRLAVVLYFFMMHMMMMWVLQSAHHELTANQAHPLLKSATRVY